MFFLFFIYVLPLCLVNKVEYILSTSAGPETVRRWDCYWRRWTDMHATGTDGYLLYRSWATSSRRLRL